nr:MAG TPA: hypothetical protein [Caudoviricetes sp.]
MHLKKSAKEYPCTIGATVGILQQMNLTNF